MSPFPPNGAHRTSGGEALEAGIGKGEDDPSLLFAIRSRCCNSACQTRPSLPVRNRTKSLARRRGEDCIAVFIAMEIVSSAGNIRARAAVTLSVLLDCAVPARARPILAIRLRAGRSARVPDLRRQRTFLHNCVERPAGNTLGRNLSAAQLLFSLHLYHPGTSG